MTTLRHIVFMAVDSLKLPLPSYFFKAQKSDDTFIKENKPTFEAFEQVLSSVDGDSNAWGDILWNHLSYTGQELGEKISDLLKKVPSILDRSGMRELLENTQGIAFAPNYAMHTVLATKLLENAPNAKVIPSKALHGSGKFADLLLNCFSEAAFPWPGDEQALNDKNKLQRACAGPFVLLPKEWDIYNDGEYVKLLKAELQALWRSMGKGHLIVLVDQMTLWLIINHLAHNARKKEYEKLKDDQKKNTPFLPLLPILPLKEGKREDGSDPEFQIGENEDVDIYFTGDCICLPSLDDNDFNLEALGLPLLNSLPAGNPPTNTAVGKDRRKFSRSSSRDRD